MAHRSASPDAVVVGSGPNGLVGANLLADAGWDVVVLEAESEPGGAVRSGELTAPGFINDRYSAFYPLAAAPAPLARLGLEDYGLRWRHAPKVLTHLSPDGSAVTMWRDVDATAESVERFAPGDGARWRALVQEWLAMEQRVLEVVLRPFPPVRSGLALLRALGVGDALRLARRFLMPIGRLGEELFRGDGARLLLAAGALHTDLPLGGCVSGGYGWLFAMLGQRRGFPVPAGGAGALTAALVARLRHRGGVVVCGARAERIVVRGGRAIGVRTADGRWWPARRAVLADVAAPSLYRELLDADVVPAKLRADLAGFRFDSATLKVDWALSSPVPWRVDGARGAGTVHLGADLTGLSRYGAALERGQVPDDTFVVCGQMTTADPERSPAGTESLWAYTHLPQRRAWAKDEIMAIVDRVEAVLERHAPGFRRTVLARRVAGPEEMQADDANLVGGAVGGGSSALHQQLVFRPVPGLGRADTPIDRLYLASASAHPGGGVHGAPGANAARAALVRAGRVTGPVYRLAIQTAQRRLYRD